MPLAYLGSNIAGLPQSKGNIFAQEGRAVPSNYSQVGGAVRPDATVSGLAFQESRQDAGEDPADVGTENAIAEQEEDEGMTEAPDKAELKDVQEIAQTGSGIRQILRENKPKLKAIQHSRRSASTLTAQAKPSLVKALEIATRHHVVQKGGALPDEEPAKSEAVKLIDPKVPLEKKQRLSVMHHRRERVFLISWAMPFQRFFQSLRPS